MFCEAITVFLVRRLRSKRLSFVVNLVPEHDSEENTRQTRDTFHVQTFRISWLTDTMTQKTYHNGQSSHLSSRTEVNF